MDALHRQIELNHYLLHSARVGNIGDVRATLGRGADINARNSHGFTVLMLAVKDRHPKTMRLLIERGANVNAKAKNEEGLTPLAVAIKSRAVEEARILLTHGASVNARIRGYGTYLHEAIVFKDISVAQLLISHGADLRHGTAHKDIQALREILHAASRVMVAVPPRGWSSQAQKNFRRLSLSMLTPISAHWHPPLLVSLKRVAIVWVMLKPNGTVTDFRIDRSGDSALDSSVIRAIRASSPFSMPVKGPLFPAGVRLQFLFVFRPKEPLNK